MDIKAVFRPEGVHSRGDARSLRGESGNIAEHHLAGERGSRDVFRRMWVSERCVVARADV